MSQTETSNLGVGQPGITVGSILVDKGDDIYTVTPSTTGKEVVAELNRMRVGALVVQLSLVEFWRIELSKIEDKFC